MKAKKAVSFLASFLMACSVASPAFAAAPPQPTAPSLVVTPYYVYINQASTSLSISGGTASVYGYVQRTASGKQIFLQSALQRYTGGAWQEVTSWSTTTTAYSAAISKTYPVSGGTYRVATYYSVSGSGGSESNTIYSNTATC